jgi:hypothetical protein
MLSYVHLFLFNWALTIGLETIIFIIIVRAWYRVREHEISLMRLILGGIFASTITIPWVWFVIPYVVAGPYVVALTCAELFAFLVETVFYWVAFKFSWKRSLAISFICNLASFVTGLALFAVARI